MTVMLALDPGGHTGYSFWQYDAITPLTHITHGTIEGGLHGFLDWWHGGLPEAHGEVVIEGFELDGRTPRPDLTPRDIIGATWALSYPTPIVVQQNTQKFFADDLFLKRSGMWWKGLGHDRDSARHAFARMRKLRHMPTLRRYWGPDAG